MPVIIYGGSVYTPAGVISNGAVVIQDTLITSIGPANEILANRGKEPSTTWVDANGGIICPGFIDLQINGAEGRLISEEPNAETLFGIARAAAKGGTTGILPTIISTTIECTLEALEVIGKHVGRFSGGAQILGSHLEGPFLNPEKAGIHKKEFLRTPSIDDLRLFWLASNKSIKLITIAPELEGAQEIVREASNLGIAVSLGHTNASAEQCHIAVENGLTFATHLFNAMEGPPARDGQELTQWWGVPDSVIKNPKIKASIIADGIHVDPHLVRKFISEKGVEGTVLVSDSMPPLGSQQPGFYLHSEWMQVKNGACYSLDGRLAGSILYMSQAVKNILDITQIPLEKVLEMATKNPSQVIGESSKRGTLQPGKVADVVVCDDFMVPTTTIVSGEIIYQHK